MSAAEILDVVHVQCHNCPLEDRGIQHIPFARTEATSGFATIVYEGFCVMCSQYLRVTALGQKTPT